MGDLEREKTEYSLKLPTTYEEQIIILKERKLIIPDEQSAINILQEINYYRLSAYFLSLKSGKNFKENVTFNQIHGLYKFDMKLRNLLLELLETIEIKFRTHIAYLIAHKYGSLGYLQSENFNNERLHSEFMIEMRKGLNRKNELFIKHHHEKYGGKIPIWVAMEVSSFGLLSKLYANMKSVDKKLIAKYYNVPYVFIENWLSVLSYIRNVCAHFARLYNKNLPRRVRLDKEDLLKLNDNNKLLAAIFIMKKLFKSSPEWTTFVTELEALIDEYKDIIEVERIGFQEDWECLLQ